MTMARLPSAICRSAMHGAGSSAGSPHHDARQSNMEMKKELAKKIARIK